MPTMAELMASGTDPASVVQEDDGTAGAMQVLANLRAKYPQYAGVDDATLATKLATKFPEYAPHVAPIIQASVGQQTVKGENNRAMAGIRDLGNKGAIFQAQTSTMNARAQEAEDAKNLQANKADMTAKATMAQSAYGGVVRSVTGTGAGLVGAFDPAAGADMAKDADMNVDSGVSGFAGRTVGSVLTTAPMLMGGPLGAAALAAQGVSAAGGVRNEVYNRREEGQQISGLAEAGASIGTGVAMMVAQKAGLGLAGGFSKSLALLKPEFDAAMASGNKALVAQIIARAIPGAAKASLGGASIGAVNAILDNTAVKWTGVDSERRYLQGVPESAASMAVLDPVLGALHFAGSGAAPARGGVPDVTPKTPEEYQSLVDLRNKTEANQAPATPRPAPSAAPIGMMEESQITPGMEQRHAQSKIDPFQRTGPAEPTDPKPYNLAPQAAAAPVVYPDHVTPDGRAAMFFGDKKAAAEQYAASLKNEDGIRSTVVEPMVGQSGWTVRVALEGDPGVTMEEYRAQGLARANEAGTTPPLAQAEGSAPAQASETSATGRLPEADPAAQAGKGVMRGIRRPATAEAAAATPPEPIPAVTPEQPPAKGNAAEPLPAAKPAEPVTPPKDVTPVKPPEAPAPVEPEGATSRGEKGEHIYTDPRKAKAEAERVNAARKAAGQPEVTLTDIPGVVSIIEDPLAKVPEKPKDITPRRKTPEGPYSPLPKAAVKGDEPGPAPAVQDDNVDPNVAPKPGRVKTVNMATLNVDPKRFQFKASHNEAGTSGALETVKKWDHEKAGVTAVWTDPADGKTYVVNGHHRYALAKRSGVETMNVLGIDAKDAQEAMVKGAMINIGEGKGSKLDAARVLRSVPAEKRAAMVEDLDTRDSHVRGGLALADLNEKLFNAVATGKLSAGHGEVIGRELANNHPAQDAVLKMLESTNAEPSNATLAEMIRQTGMAENVKQTSEGLFGTDTKEISSAMTRAKLAGDVRAQLVRSAKTLNFVMDPERAKMLTESKVAEIDAETGTPLAKEAAELQFLYGSEAHKKGSPIAEALTKGAAEIAAGGNAKEIKTRVTDEVIQGLREVNKEMNKPAVDEGPGLNFGEGEQHADMGLFGGDGEPPRKPAMRGIRKEPVDENQGGLFTGAAKPQGKLFETGRKPESPKATPEQEASWRARRPGETVEDWRIRMKFGSPESVKATPELPFQEGETSADAIPGEVRDLTPRKRRDVMADVGKKKVASAADDYVQAYGERAWVSDDGKTAVKIKLPGEEAHRTLVRTPMPELVTLAKQLMGELPTVNRRLRNALGMFTASEDGSISINPILGKNPQTLAKVLAHEIGHLVDYLPDKTMKRGNLLGRLLTLHGYLKDKMGNLSAKDLRKELISLSAMWKGAVPADAPEAYRNYRNSSKELYADLLSVMLNDPKLASEKAPISWRLVMGHLDAKPDVREAYLNLMDTLSGNPEAMVQARRGSKFEQYAKGDEIINAAIAERDSANATTTQGFIDMMSRLFMNRGRSLTKRQASIEKLGIEVPDAYNARRILAELNYADNQVHLFIGDIEKIHQALKGDGLDVNTAGYYLEMKRIQAGDRGGLINPGGTGPKDAQVNLDGLRESIGPEKFAALEKHMKRWHDTVFSIMREGAKAGLYTPETWQKIMENKDNYATFAVLKYLRDNLPASIKKQVGTFEDIANPWQSTMMKMVSTIRLTALNNAKRGVLAGFMPKYFPGDITQVAIPFGKVEPSTPAKPGFDYVTYLHNGKPRAVEVEHGIAEAFKGSDIGELNRFSRIIASPTYAVFHKLYITLNDAFAARNLLFRDPARTAKNLGAIKGISMLETIMEHVRSMPTAWKRAAGMDDATINQMLKEGALAAPFVGRMSNVENVGAHDRMVIEQSIRKMEPSKNMAVRAFKAISHGIEAINVFGETNSKVAAWNTLEKHGVTGPERAEIVRRFVGTPDWKQKGTATYLSNSTLLYSNVRWQGIAADAALATNPKTAAGWWWRQAATTIAPRTLMFAAAAGMLGKGLEDIFKMIPGWAKQNYECVPLGVTGVPGQEKAIFGAIPDDDTGKVLGKVWWNILNAKNTGGGAMAQNVFGSLQNELVPGLHPLANIGTTWATYAAGRNPVDQFRNREILPKDVALAGGWDANKKMLHWTVDQFGVATIFTSPMIGDSSETMPMTTVERAVKGTPFFRGLVKVSGQGTDEARWDAVDLAERESARARLNLGPEIHDLVKEHYKLQRFYGQKELTPAEMGRLQALNGYYTKVYLPMTKAINAADAAGNDQRAGYLRNQLNAISERFKKE